MQLENRKMAENKVDGSSEEINKANIYPYFDSNKEFGHKVSKAFSLNSSKVSVSSHHSTCCSIQATYDLNFLRADHDIIFSHRSYLQYLSKASSKLQLLKKDYDYLLWVKSSLKLTYQLKEIEETIASINLSLDSINSFLSQLVKGKHEIMEDFKTLTLLLVEKLERCIASIDESLTSMKAITLNCSSHYNKMIKKFRNFGYTSSNLSYCNQIAKRLKSMFFKVLHLESYFQLSRCGELDSSVVTAIIYNCDLMLKSLVKLCGETRNLFSWKLHHYYDDDDAELTLSFSPPLQYDQQSDIHNTEAYNVTYYVKKIAEFRSSLISKEICRVLESTLLNDMENNADIYSSTSRLDLRSKEISISLLRWYDNFLAEELMYISKLTKGIRDRNKDGYKIELLSLTNLESNCTSRYKRNTNYVYWDSSMGPAINDSLHKVYEENLWKGVITLIMNTYIASAVDGTEEQFHLSDSNYLALQSDVLKCCIKKLCKDNCSWGLSEALSALLISVVSFHELQEWDQGLCKAMGAALKDKCRYIDRNPGIGSGSMIGLLLNNQMKQMNILNCFKTFYQNLMDVDNGKHHSILSFNFSVFLPAKIFLSYLMTYFNYKRQYFLIAGCWEQFFMVTSCSMDNILHFTDHLLNFIEENFVIKSSLNFICSHLVTELEEIKSFEEKSLSLFYRAVAYRTRKGFEEHMPTGKVWKRVGQHKDVHNQESNPYINVLINLIFPSLLENLRCLPKKKRIQILEFCFLLFWKSWRGFILEKQIMFSWFGGRQLKLDFEYFIEWFNADKCGYTAEELSSLQSLDVLKDMRSIGFLLCCQPQGISGMFIGSRFDQVIGTIHLHDKERWLGLQVKSNQSRKFFCTS